MPQQVVQFLLTGAKACSCVMPYVSESILHKYFCRNVAGKIVHKVYLVESFSTVSQVFARDACSGAFVAGE